MHRLTLLLPGLLLPIFACADQEPAQVDAQVKLDIVKQKELVKALEAARGQVVLVDIWAEF